MNVILWAAVGLSALLLLIAIFVTCLVLGVKAMREDEIIGGLLFGLAFIMFIAVCIIGVLEGGGT